MQKNERLPFCSLDFARELADDFIVMDRGAVVLAGDRDSMVESEVRSHVSV